MQAAYLAGILGCAYSAKKDGANIFILLSFYLFPVTTILNDSS